MSDKNLGSEGSDIRWYRYVPIHKVDDYLGLGWIAHDSLRYCRHGLWSVLMEWTKDGNPREARDVATD